MSNTTDYGRMRTFADAEQRVVTTPEDVDDRDDLSAFTVRAEQIPDRVEARQEERSLHERTMDSHFNAPVTTDPQKWAANPSHWDYPGVDTISEDVLNDRTTERFTEAFERGVVENYEEKPLDGGTKGRHRSGDVVLDLDVAAGNEEDPRFQKPSTLAHELGHAIDYNSTDQVWHELSNAMLAKKVDEQKGELVTSGDPDVWDELVDVSKKRRGAYENASADRKRYREEPRELFADFYASLVQQPRATKRDAPTAVEKLQTIEEQGLVETDVPILDR